MSNDTTTAIRIQNIQIRLEKEPEHEVCNHGRKKDEAMLASVPL
jgi:hypothetical protein